MSVLAPFAPSDELISRGNPEGLLLFKKKM
jgi:hypothetical protein